MDSQACGLDFGTTNSTLGIVSGGAPRLIALEDGHLTMPTALFFGFEDRLVHFGRKAVFEYVDGAEGRFMRALKSVLGSSLMAETTRIGPRRMSFVEVIGLFIQRLKARLEADTGRAADHVVLGRPVQFVDGDPAADREAEEQLAEAARTQGFRHIEFQFEPVAAALNYERGVNREELALVADIGGGTSDFSVIRLSPEGSRRAERKDDILANTGIHIGGTDLDRLLSIARVMPLLGYGSSTADGKRRLPVWYFNDLTTWHRINTLYDPKVVYGLKQLQREAAHPERIEKLLKVLQNRAGHRLAGEVERAKIALSDVEAALVQLKEPDLLLEQAVTRAELEASIEPLVRGIVGSLAAALDQAGVPASAIDTLLLTGGSTRVPSVRASITEFFPAAQVVETDAFGSVGRGLALDAQRKFG